MAGYQESNPTNGCWGDMPYCNIINRSGIYFFHPFRYCHYSDVKMSAMASQTTSLTIVYSTVNSGADQRKHQSPAFVRRIHRWPVNSPDKGPVTQKMFPLMTSSYFADVVAVVPTIWSAILDKVLHRRPSIPFEVSATHLEIACQDIKSINIWSSTWATGTFICVLVKYLVNLAFHGSHFANIEINIGTQNYGMEFSSLPYHISGLC